MVPSLFEPLNMFYKRVRVREVLLYFYVRLFDYCRECAVSHVIIFHAFGVLFFTPDNAHSADALNTHYACRGAYHKI